MILVLSVRLGGNNSFAERFERRRQATHIYKTTSFGSRSRDMYPRFGWDETVGDDTMGLSPQVHHKRTSIHPSPSLIVGKTLRK